jgi:hypothetical protein
MLQKVVVGETRKQCNCDLAAEEIGEKFLCWEEMGRQEDLCFGSTVSEMPVMIELSLPIDRLSDC